MNGREPLDGLDRVAAVYVALRAPKRGENVTRPTASPKEQ